MNRNRHPFWLPASNYYVMSVAISAAFFFVIWGILHDSGEETPWITAGISASMLLCGAVIMREIILRRVRERFVREQRRLERGFSNIRPHHNDLRSSKLTLERNAAVLDELNRKSEAARVLNRFSAGHREVFELCAEYISQNEGELKTVSASSPRLSALLKGRSMASDLHRYHMLRWAEIEVTTLTDEARDLAEPEEKIDAARTALAVIDQSLTAYPTEPSLVQSRELLQELMVSIRVSDHVEKAERAAFEHDFSRARGLYRDALFALGRDNVQSPARDAAAERIRTEIDRISGTETQGEG